MNILQFSGTVQSVCCLPKLSNSVLAPNQSIQAVHTQLKNLLFCTWVIRVWLFLSLLQLIYCKHWHIHIIDTLCGWKVEDMHIQRKTKIFTYFRFFLCRSRNWQLWQKVLNTSSFPFEFSSFIFKSSHINPHTHTMEPLFFCGQ